MAKSIGVKMSLAVLMAVSFFAKIYSQRYAEMSWQDTIQVDGKSKEWEFPLPLYDPKTKLNFNFSNDANRLYFVFVANEDIARYKILSSGFTLEIDTVGGKKYNTELLFEPNVAAYKNGPSAYTSNVDTTYKRPSWTIPINITAKGLKNVPNGILGPNSRHGIQIAITPNDEFGRMFCEISVPFNLFYKDSLKATGTENVFGIRVTLNRIESKGNSTMNSGGTGGSVTAGGYVGPAGAYNGVGTPGSGGMYPTNSGYPNNGGSAYPNNGSNFPSADNTDQVAPTSTTNPELTTKTSFVIKLQPRIPPIK